MRPYQGTINHWFPLIRPAIKALGRTRFCCLIPEVRCILLEMGITPCCRDPTTSATYFDPSGPKEVIGFTDHTFPPPKRHHKKERITESDI